VTVRIESEDLRARQDPRLPAALTLRIFTDTSMASERSLCGSRTSARPSQEGRQYPGLRGRSAQQRRGNLALCGVHHFPVDRNDWKYTTTELLEWKEKQVVDDGSFNVRNEKMVDLSPLLSPYSASWARQRPNCLPSVPIYGKPVTNQVTTPPGNTRQGSTCSDSDILPTCGNPT